MAPPGGDSGDTELLLVLLDDASCGAAGCWEREAGCACDGCWLMETLSGGLLWEPDVLSGCDLEPAVPSGRSGLRGDTDEFACKWNVVAV